MEKTLLGCYSAGASLDSAGKCQTQPQSMWVLHPCPQLTVGTDSTPTPRDLLPGGTYRSAGPWHEGKEEVFGGRQWQQHWYSAQEIPHVLGMRNALCQALEATVLSVKMFWLMILTRGFTQLDPSAPFPNHFHAF